MGGGTTDGQNSRPQPSRKKPTEFCNTFAPIADIAQRHWHVRLVP